MLLTTQQMKRNADEHIRAIKGMLKILEEEWTRAPRPIAGNCLRDIQERVTNLIVLVVENNTRAEKE